jgi:hypothetical protein
MILFHYTCGRNAALIDYTGRLIPQPQELHGGDPLLWLTQIHSRRGRRSETARNLGLTWHYTRKDCADMDPACDPLAERYSVLVDGSMDVVPFEFFLSRYPHLRPIYENLPGALLHTWWVSYVSLPIRRKPARTSAGVHRGV